jgi:uncharacterized protein YecE (DUF72 family)
MNPKPPRLEPIRQPTLFEMEKEQPNVLMSKQEVERPYDQHPDMLIGTSAFTAAGWPGAFYPAGMKSSEYLTYYATQFKTVEIDSTYYGTPSAATVSNWYQKTPPDFIFAAKVPQVVTHDKVLVDCEREFDEFIERMDLLNEKLGPMVFQFPFFDRWKFPKREDFFAVLGPFLKKLPADHKFAVEIRNKTWLNARFTDLLREHNVSLALTDTSFMPRPWEMKGSLDLVTADFAYVRWLGDRKGIEKLTTTWDKPVVDRRADLKNWSDLLSRLVLDKRLRKIFAFANNHYAGHGPATVKLFWNLWNKS